MGVNTYVDYRVSVGLVGRVLQYIGLAPLAPLLAALYYGESPVPFVATSAVMLAVGLLFERVLGREGDLGRREAFLLVSLAWLVVPLGLARFAFSRGDLV